MAFVRIRRNRHDIARSFAMKFGTPCRKEYVFDETLQKMKKNGRSPNVSYCPLEDNETPIALPLIVRNDRNNTNTEKINMWKRQLTPYQKFLWMADEIEYRYYKLLNNYPNSRYYEITWSNSSELQDGVDNVKQTFYEEWKHYFDTTKLINNNNNNTDSSNSGDDKNNDDNNDNDEIISHSIIDKKIVHMKKHTTKLEKQLRNCTKEIEQDLQYRQWMQYDQHVSFVLFQRYPQIIHSD